jgi:hypothetical protein
MIAKESPEWFVHVANIPIAEATLPSTTPQCVLDGSLSLKSWPDRQIADSRLSAKSAAHIRNRDDKYG